MKKRTLQRDVSLESIVELLQRDIIDGVYIPGRQLKQTEIASMLGVSQGPVREALIRLVSEGLVENVPFRGMFVRKLEKTDVEEIYQLRTALETLAAKLALSTLKQEKHLAELREFIKQITQAESEGNFSLAAEMDLGFHRYIVELSENIRLINIWNSLLAQSHYALRQLYENEIQKQGNVNTLAKNHLPLLDVIQKGTLNEIGEALADHMETASNQLSHMIESREQ
jgi:DNA-binding GntR family transcriptional regulator